MQDPGRAPQVPEIVSPPKPAASVVRERAEPMNTEILMMPSSHRGARIGMVYGLHPGRTRTLPDGMHEISAVNHADGWGLVVAERGVDLVLLLTDDQGVVVDDLAVIRGAGKYQVLVNCGDETLPSLLPVDACASNEDSGTIVALRSWETRGGVLTMLEDGATCSCAVKRN